MKIITNDNHIEVYTPYNKDFVARIKTAIGGSKWNRTKGCWTVPAESIAEVRQLMLECYGENDIETPDYVSVKLTFNESMCDSYQGITIFGKTIARAYGRDTVGAIDKDVNYIKGLPLSGGSRNHPLALIDKGAEIKIYCKLAEEYIHFFCVAVGNKVSLAFFWLEVNCILSAYKG